jgi:hypothetical protein
VEILEGGSGMTTKEKAKLVQLLQWGINKMFENPTIEICWNEVCKCAAEAWEEVTGINVK